MNYQRQAWMDKKKCIDVHPSFFFDKFEKATPEDRAIFLMNYCYTCEAKEECAKFRKDNAILYGLWGGEYFNGKKRPTGFPYVNYLEDERDERNRLRSPALAS